MSSKKYDEGVDWAFLHMHGVLVTKIMPWQFRLEHPDIIGRFVWYPKKGTLMYEKPDWGVSKVGEFHNAEHVYDRLMEKSK